MTKPEEIAFVARGHAFQLFNALTACTKAGATDKDRAEAKALLTAIGASAAARDAENSPSPVVFTIGYPDGEDFTGTCMSADKEAVLAAVGQLIDDLGRA